MKKKIIGAVLTGALSLGVFNVQDTQAAEIHTFEKAQMHGDKAKKDLMTIKDNVKFSNVKIDAQVSREETPPSVSFSTQYKGTHFNVAKPEESWSRGFKGQNVKVAVLDTGIDVDHSDLYVSGGKSFVPYTTSYDDDQGHGTHVAGIIAAKDNSFGVVGIAPSAKLYAVKVLDDIGYGEVPWITKGIRWAIANDMDVINMSLGLDSWEESGANFNDFIAALNEADAAGITVVASAGNDGTYGLDYPAKHPTVISVGGIHSDTLEKVDFSNYANYLELVAPAYVMSTYPRDLESYIGVNGYEFMAGTSMSAPIVAGMAALYKSTFPTHAPSLVKTNMTNNSKWRYDLGAVGYDSWYGYGVSSNKNYY